MDKTKNFFACDSCQEKKSKESILFWDNIPKSFDSNSIGPIILENYFIKIARSFKIEVTRYYILFQNHLVYKSKLTKKYKKIVKLDNVIFDTKITNNNKTFSLILKTANLEIELMTNDKKQFEIWEIQLSKICLRINFENHYNIVSLLGSGNYSKVYLAKKISDGKKFAVKIFKKTVLNCDLKGHKLILNEIKLTRKLSHPSIVEVYETYKYEGTFCMIMEYMAGGELLEVINKGRVSEVKCAIIMKKLIEGLSYLYSKNILHRDLKFENLLLNDKNDYSTLKIADFGFATYLEEISTIYSRCGTPGFVAPEVLNVTKEPFCKYVNHKSDVFGAGCIMYRLITGNFIFNATKIKNILKLNKECKINFDSLRFKHTSRSALNLLNKMLIKDPKNRIDTNEILNHEFFNKDRTEMSIVEDDFCSINNKLICKFNMEQLKKRNLSTNSTLNSKISLFHYSSKNMETGSIELPGSDCCFNMLKSAVINVNNNTKEFHSQIDDDSIEPSHLKLLNHSKKGSSHVKYSITSPLHKDSLMKDTVFSITSPSYKDSLVKDTVFSITSPSYKDTLYNSSLYKASSTLGSTSPLSMNGKINVLQDTVFNDYMSRYSKKAKTHHSTCDIKVDNPIKNGPKKTQASNLSSLDLTGNNSSNQYLAKDPLYNPLRLKKLNVVIEGNEQG